MDDEISDDPNINLMPPIPQKNGIASAKRFMMGAARSQRRLEQLKHDPILKQVKVYWKLEAEVKRLEQIRSGERIELDHDGKPRKYSADAHIRMIEQMQKINEVLMRYGYGRVPEIEGNFGNNIPQLTIHLENDPEVIDVDSTSSRTV